MSRIDFLLNENNGLKITDYDFTLTSSEEFIKQKLKIVLSTFRGEWFLDTEVGMPFFQDMLGKNIDLGKLESLYIRAINSIPEVNKLIYLDLEEDKQTRTLSVKFAVTDNENNIIEVVI